MELVGEPPVKGQRFAHGLGYAPAYAPGFVVEVPHASPYHHARLLEVARGDTPGVQGEGGDGAPFDRRRRFVQRGEEGRYELLGRDAVE